uniref:DDE Tnp4 domain-containing protein n=1 Tax=Strigamia maritima TaxID=126957 RepID=T1IU51_STRMM
MEMDELRLILSCAPTLLSVLTEPPSLLNYLMDEQRKRKNNDILIALADQENDTIQCEKRIKLKIIELVEKTNIKPVQRGRPIMPLRKMVLLSVWLLTNQEGFRCVSVRFGIGKGHAHRAFEIFCVTLHSISHEYVKWPSVEEGKNITDGFEKMSGLPSVMGAIGIIHVTIPKPSNNDELFHNRHGFHSVILQGICNHQYEFINVLAGPPGATHESDVWSNSPLHEKIVEIPHEILYDNSYLIASGAYPSTDFIFPPYDEQQSWRAEYESYNNAHAVVHNTIKTVFKLFLSRFQRLTFLNMSRLDLIPKVIIAGCVLHNLCIQENEKEIEVENHNVDKFYEVSYVNKIDVVTEHTKRDEISANLLANVQNVN